MKHLAWDNQGWNAATLCTKKGRRDILLALRDTGMNVVEAIDGCGRTPLYVAAMLDDVDMAKWLVEELGSKVHQRCYITSPRPWNDGKASKLSYLPQDTVTPWGAAISYRSIAVQRYLGVFYDKFFFDFVKNRDIIEVKLLAQNPRINRDYAGSWKYTIVAVLDLNIFMGRLYWLDALTLGYEKWR